LDKKKSCIFRNWKTKEKIEGEADYRVTLTLGPKDEAAKNRVTCREKNKAHFVIFIWKAQWCRCTVGRNEPLPIVQKPCGADALSGEMSLFLLGKSPVEQMRCRAK
jgi:hypothetical protein